MDQVLVVVIVDSVDSFNPSVELVDEGKLAGKPPAGKDRERKDIMESRLQAHPC